MKQCQEMREIRVLGQVGQCNREEFVFLSVVREILPCVF